MDLAAVPYEYESGGVEKTTINVQGGYWQRTLAAFGLAFDAAGERVAIQAAVKECELAAGEQTPTWQDRPRSVPRFGSVGQLDCIAESNNTTTFLLVLRQEDLLRFHEVLRPEFRTQYLLFDPHRTALVRERATGVVYAIDSWLGKNGEEPLVQEYGAWRRKETPR